MPITLWQLFKLSIKELRHQRSTVLLFSLSLAIGLFALISVDSFKVAVEGRLRQQAKSILGADIGVGSRQPLKKSDIQKAEAVLGKTLLQKSELVETFTMLTVNDLSRLVEIKAIETNYPLHGSIKLSSNELSTESEYRIPKNGVLLYPETLVQLGIKKGDKIDLGGHSFTVSESVLADPAAIGTGFNFAPTVYISLADLKSTNLIQKGSTGYNSVLYKLTNTASIPELESELKRNLPDASIRILTPEGSSQQVSQLTRYLSDYLSLASLVALLLATFGCGYLYKSYLNKNSKTIATYKILGLRNGEVRKLFIFHSWLLSSAALAIALGVAYIVLPALSGLGKALLNLNVQVGLTSRTVLLASGVAFLGSLLINSPLIRLLDKVEPKSLIQQQPYRAHLSLLDSTYYLPLAGFFLLAVYILSNSIQASTYFIFGMASAAAVLLLASLLVAAVFRRLSRAKGFATQWILRSIVRNIREFNFAYFCMSIGLILILLIPMIESGIQNEIKTPDSQNTPSFFLFDIQNDQLAPLQEFLAAKAVNIQSSAPMIRSRLQSVNGIPFSRSEGENLTTEQERENRMRNRGYNLTYRSSLRKTEKIIEGKFWPKEASETALPEISVETRFADRLDLKIGDHLTFDVEGLPVEGKITSLRKVKWTSFQPNFFLQFQPHPFLKELPQTHVMAVKAPSSTAIADLQNQLATKFPSISVIDIVRLAEGLTGIIDQLSSALRLVGLTSVVVGLLILFSMINQRAVEKRKQANLLRVLGADTLTVYAATLGEFVVLIFLTLTSGVFLSLVLNSALLYYIFDALPRTDFSEVLTVCFVVLVVSIIVSFLAVRRALITNPNELLKEGPA